MKRLILLFLFTNLVTAQNFKKGIQFLTNKNQKCLDSGEFMYECSNKFHLEIDSLLNVVYNNIRSKLKKEDKNILKTEQLSWLKSRDLKFKKIESEKTGLGNGLDELMIKQQSKADFVLKRINFLITNYLSDERKNFNTHFLKFIPKNYVILDSVRGNLNKDAYDDFVLVLKKKNEEETSNFNDDKPEKRPLLIFLGNANKKIDFKLRTDNAVLCVDGSGGIHGDSYERITIKDGYFSIEYYTVGGIDKWSKVTTFKYDLDKKNWFLYRDGMEFFKFNNSNKPNAEAVIKTGEEIKTKKDFGSILLQNYSVYK